MPLPIVGPNAMLVVSERRLSASTSVAPVAGSSTGQVPTRQRATPVQSFVLCTALQA